MKIRITSTFGEVCTECEDVKTLSEVIADAGMSISAPCGGNGKCGKCAVYANGALSEPDKAEIDLLGDRYSRGMRLACMCKAVGNCEITLDMSETYAESGEYRRSFVHDKREGYGIAIDIGTTTLVFYLYDLYEGTEIGVTTALNPQGLFGGDVISRIESALDGHLSVLKQMITDAISSNIEKLCTAHNVGIPTLTDIVITGNTVMMYLLCGIEPRSLASAPFHTDEYFGMYVPSSQFGLGEQTKVYLTRSVSAYVGGDITSAATAVALPDSEGSALLIDIGTNGESMAYCGGKLLCASAAAGPCFEGVGITCGMMAKEGAINSVKKVDGKVVCTTVAGKPSGLCGSGLIDSVALMLDEGVIDENGTFDDEVNEFYLPDTEVFLTRGDIRAVQLAKSAICSSVETLMHELGIASFDRVYLAGGFGNNIDPDSAFRIGLLPRGLSKNVIRVGNAAGYGASIILLGEKERVYSETIAKSARTLELSTDAFFGERFIENMGFYEGI